MNFMGWFFFTLQTFLALPVYNLSKGFKARLESFWSRVISAEATILVARMLPI